jgi:hypothetical protein
VSLLTLLLVFAPRSSALRSYRRAVMVLRLWVVYPVTIGEASSVAALAPLISVLVLYAAYRSPRRH